MRIVALWLAAAALLATGGVGQYKHAVSAGFFIERPDLGALYWSSDTNALFGGAGPLVGSLPGGIDHDPKYDYAFQTMLTVPAHGPPFFLSPGFERYNFPNTWYDFETGYTEGKFSLWQDADGYAMGAWGQGQLLLTGTVLVFNRWHDIIMPFSTDHGEFEGYLIAEGGLWYEELRVKDWHIIGDEMVTKWEHPGVFSEGEVGHLKIEAIPEPGLVSLAAAACLALLARRNRN